MVSSILSSGRLQRALLGILVLLVAALAVVIITDSGAGGQSAAATSHATSIFRGPTMPAHLKAANFTLTDQNGKPVTLRRDLGRVVVLTFIHSKCHDTCPFMTQQIRGALNDLPAHGDDVATIGVSVDHREDTPASRRAFLRREHMTGRLQFVNGPVPSLRRIWEAYGIAPDTARTDHSAFVLLIDKRGYVRVGFAADQLTPPALAHDIRLLQRERT